MSRETDIAWLAGLLDGEGCLEYARSTGRNKRPQYTARFCISMYDQGAIEKAGYIMDADPKKVRGIHTRGLTRWEVRSWGDKLESLLREMLPYLTTKKEQALLLLEARAQCPPASKVGVNFKAGENSVSNEAMAMREGFHLILKEAKGYHSAFTGAVA